MRDARMWRRPAAAMPTFLGDTVWDQEHGFLSLPGGRVYGLWRLDDRLGVHILIGSGWPNIMAQRRGVRSDLAAYYGKWSMAWYPIKDPARPRSPLCPSSWLETCLLSPTILCTGQEGVILKSKIDAMKGLLWMPRKRRDVIHRASEVEISRFIYSCAETQRN